MKTCPRCGRKTMRDNNIENALSRHCDVFICHDCGADEAFEDAGFVSRLPLEEWAINKESEEYLC